MKDGLILENGELIYYKDGQPKHAGVIKIEDSVYYISAKGRAVKGVHVVHTEMSNGILKRGTYTFGEDYKLVENSYIPPKKPKKPKHKSSRSKTSKRKRRESQFLIFLSCFCLLFICGTFLFSAYKNTSKQEPPPVAPPVQEIILPTFPEKVLLCSEQMKAAWDGEGTLAEVAKYGNPYRSFAFTYDLKGSSGVLKLGKKADLSDAKTYVMAAGSNKVVIDNLETTTTYYYTVTVNETVYPGSFQTASSPRFVSIPGLVNTRDIGGYTNRDGQTVRQGLLIRGVEPDGLVNVSYYIPKSALQEVQDTFGFVYQFDLRAPSIYPGTYTSRLGIPHAFYSSPQYGGIFDGMNKPFVRKIFADLANPEHYPMYLHCTWGMDRTGTIIFLLQGLLNISEEKMIQEYQLSGFANPELLNSTNMDVIINHLQSYPGSTLNEKIVAFLTKDIGVTQDEIAAIRNIFLEPAN